MNQDCNSTFGPPCCACYWGWPEFCSNREEGGEVVAKTTIMIDGLCYRRHCFNTGPRCGKGFCGSCCKAFHEHTGPRPGAPTGTINDATHVPASSVVSTAIKPDPPPVYEVGQVQLVCTQEINPTQGR